jgi:hypothetical protein
MVTVTELLVVKNNSANAVDTAFYIPRYRSVPNSDTVPNFPVSATWDKTNLTMTAAPSDASVPAGVTSSPLMAPVHFGAGATAGVRISYSTPFGKVGAGALPYKVGFDMPGPRAEGANTISQLNFSLKYGQRTVFGLPDLLPTWPWQVSKSGASVRITDYAMTNQLVTATFYTGDYKGGD